MDSKKRPARQLAEACGTMNYDQIVDFLEAQGFHSYPKRRALMPKKRRALEEFREEFVRERNLVTGKQPGDEDRKATETVCALIRRRLRRWELAAAARRLLKIYPGLDWAGLVAFLGEYGFHGEPETWTWEETDELDYLGHDWCLRVWTRNVPPDMTKDDQGYPVVSRVLEEFRVRWESAQPIRVKVSVQDFHEDRKDDIFKAWDLWDAHDKGHEENEDELSLVAELPKTERDNEGGIARGIADDLFRANAAPCTVSVSFGQGLGDESTEYRTFEFGPKYPGDGYFEPMLSDDEVAGAVLAENP